MNLIPHTSIINVYQHTCRAVEAVVACARIDHTDAVLFLTLFKATSIIHPPASWVVLSSLLINKAYVRNTLP